MLEMFLGLEFLLVLFSVCAWGVTGFAANQLKYAVQHAERQRRWRRVTRLGVWIGLILVALWIVTILLFWMMWGWFFVMDRILVMLPLLAAGSLLVLGCAAPQLSNVKYHAGALVTILVSVHTMLVATVMTFYLITVDVPAIPEKEEIATCLGLLAVAVGLLWLYHRRRIRRIQLRQPSVAARIVRGAGFVGFVIVTGLLVMIVSLRMSMFPDTMSMVSHHAIDFGGGAEFEMMAEHAHSQHASAAGMVSVADLTGPRVGEPDKQFTLYAEKRTIRLSSGEQIDAWTFNGQVPGPSLVVDEGDLVEVSLVNRDIESGVTLHWHGVDVPNAEDGVAGMTQDAVMPGDTYTYRFIVQEAGSHWYHSHQQSSIQVQKGLYGPFIITPKYEQADENGLDMTTMVHDWSVSDHTLIPALDTSDTLQNKAVEPGTPVRLRLMNSSSYTKRFTLNGTAYRIAAVDGHAIHEPSELTDSVLRIGGGGRYDLVFTMPEDPVTLALPDDRTEAGIVFSKDGRGAAAVLEQGKPFELTAYGTPQAAFFHSGTEYDREFTMILDQTYFGVYNGEAGQTWLINGEAFPNTPTLMVREGDLVKTTFVNRSFADHPMHLHGHHIQVLSRNGKPVSGSPLVLDTLLVQPGEIYEVAFEANNPGLWMDHCHNLDHASMGMTLHLAYENVTTPYAMGGATGNHPE